MMTRSIGRLTFAFILCLLFSVFSLAAFAQSSGDELHLRDGTVVRGEALSHDQRSVVFRSASGVRTYSRAEVASIVFGGVATGGAIPPGISAGPGLKIKRWYTWRKITDNPRDNTAKHIFYAKLSGNGQKIVFCGREGVYTIGFDGSDLTQLTSEQTGRCDISADGRRVVWHNDKEGIMQSAVDGTGKESLPGGLKPTALKISGDGSAIFVLDYEKDGIFRVTPDGSDIKRVLTTTEVSKANSVEENRNYWRADSLNVSNDGRRVVFRFLWDAFAFDTVTGSLRQFTRYLTPEDRNLVTAAVSPNGSKVAYMYYGGVDKHFITVQDWSGENPVTHNGLGPGMSGMQLLSDGSAFGGGSFVRLLRPDGRTREEVFGFAEAPMFDTPSHASCSQDGKRMILLTDGVVSVDQGRGSQIHVIEANPPSIAGFPTLNDIRARPTFVPVSGTTTATISTKAGERSELNMVYAFLTRENLLGYDLNLARYSGDGWLMDNATRGDTTANDGIYTGNQFTPHQYVTRPIEPGPLTLRVFARTKAGSLTVVDLEGMEARRQ